MIDHDPIEVSSSDTSGEEQWLDDGGQDAETALVALQKALVREKWMSQMNNDPSFEE